MAAKAVRNSGRSMAEVRNEHWTLHDSGSERQVLVVVISVRLAAIDSESPSELPVQVTPWDGVEVGLDLR